MEAVVAVAALVVVVAMFPVVSYNRFVAQRQAIASAWATVDAELDRRHRLIPPLVDLVRAEAVRELSVFTELAAVADEQMRTPDPDERGRLEPAVHRAVATATSATSAISVREELASVDAQASFDALQRSLTMTEDRIAAARRVYNARVASMNRRIDAFPSRLVAARMGLERVPFFAVGDSA